MDALTLDALTHLAAYGCGWFFGFGFSRKTFTGWAFANGVSYIFLATECYLRSHK